MAFGRLSANLWTDEPGSGNFHAADYPGSQALYPGKLFWSRTFRRKTLPPSPYESGVFFYYV